MDEHKRKYTKGSKHLISTGILDMMGKRKRGKNSQNYDEVNRRVKLACKITKLNWLKYLKESIFIHIPKIPKATRCHEYRTISMMSQVTNYY